MHAVLFKRKDQTASNKGYLLRTKRMLLRILTAKRMIVTLRVTMIVTDAPANIAYPLKGDSKQRVTMVARSATIVALRATILSLCPAGASETIVSDAPAGQRERMENSNCTSYEAQQRF